MLPKVLIMKRLPSPYGEIVIAEKETLFDSFTSMIRDSVKEVTYPPGVALTGGSTPKDYFKWLADHPDKLPEAKENVVFTVSDERYVPLESDESNYGNAMRMFLDPVGIIDDHRYFWDTSRDPVDAARWYQQLWELSFGEDATYDICMLGMGGDCHTASLFPGSPLLEQLDDNGDNFASVLVPDKGERLTITPRGLKRCGRIVIFVLGEGKAEAVKRIFRGDENTSVSEIPVRLFKHFPEKVTWLMDEAATSLL